MLSRSIYALVAVGILLAATPVRAQYAFRNVAVPTEETTGSDPEAGNKDYAYKVVHGVVQNKHGVLPGATVWLHGTHTIVVTNSEGEFELRVPADTKFVELTCSYGGLQDEVVSLAPVQAMGSIYLLHTTAPSASHQSIN